MTAQPQRSSTTRVILLSWLLVGTLDILAAFIDVSIAGKKPLPVLNYIASGVFGRPALKGGTDMMLLGLLFHYIIALIFTLIFFWLYPRWPLMSKNRIVTGIVYGLFIWAVMNLGVVQLSNAPHAPIGAIKIDKAIKAYLILTCLIGLPLSFIAYNHFKNRRRTASS